MKKLFSKIALAVFALGILLVPSQVHASGEKFVVEQIFRNSSADIGVYFFVNDGGTLSNEFNTNWSASTYASEDALKSAINTAIVSWATSNGYPSATAADVQSGYQPVLATVAKSGLASDLTTDSSNRFVTDSDKTSWNGKADASNVGKAYEGTTARSGAFPIFKSVTVSSGTAIFYLTNDGTSGGTALFPNGVIADSVNAFVSDAAASYQMAYAFSNSNKTLTVTTNKLTTANILTGILGQSAANGSVVKLSVWGY